MKKKPVSLSGYIGTCIGTALGVYHHTALGQLTRVLSAAGIHVDWMFSKEPYVTLTHAGTGLIFTAPLSHRGRFVPINKNVLVVLETADRLLQAAAREQVQV